jgi:Questin oxidase-like
MTDPSVLDEAYERLHTTGPEFRGWLSNHGPMAADSLIRLGRADDVRSWVEGYALRLEPAPGSRWVITDAGWRDPLGDASRLGDWLAFFARQVREDAWEHVLALWWPRLLPGAAASATHGLIRTGHAVRALQETVTAPRVEELGQALAYWAARWQPVPGSTPAVGTRDVGAALDELPRVPMDEDWGARARLARLGGLDGWPEALAAAAPPTATDDVPAAIDRLVDATVSRYAAAAAADPVMLIHASTAPRAAGLALASLPRDQWAATYDAAWSVAAAITVAYRSTPDQPAVVPPTQRLDTNELADAAVELGDEHVIKFVEVVAEAHRRGVVDALGAGAVAEALISRG